MAPPSFFSFQKDRLVSLAIYFDRIFGPKSFFNSDSLHTRLNSHYEAMQLQEKEAQQD